MFKIFGVGSISRLKNFFLDPELLKSCSQLRKKSFRIHNTDTHCTVQSSKAAVHCKLFLASCFQKDVIYDPSLNYRMLCASCPPSKRSWSTCALYCARTPPACRSDVGDSGGNLTKPGRRPRRRVTAGSATATSCLSRIYLGEKKRSTGSRPWPSSSRRTCHPTRKLFRDVALQIMNFIRF